MAKQYMGPKGPFLYVELGGKRRKLQLTRFTETIARTICHHVSELESAVAASASIPAATAAWLTEIDDDLHSRIAKLGLCPTRERIKLVDAVERLLRAARVQEITRTKKRMNLNSFVKFVGNIYLDEVAVGHAEAYEDHLKTLQIQPATRAKKMIEAKALLKWGGFPEPFAWWKPGPQGQKHKPYIDVDVVERLIEYAPTPSWKMLIALSRYAGLRIPSEIRELKWMDIDWQGKDFRVLSPKTKHKGKGERRVPLWNELQLHMEPHKQYTGYVLGDLRLKKLYGRDFARWAKNIGIEMWPSPFHSMRASRITDLLKIRPVQAVALWMGNSPAVIWDHYAQTLDNDVEGLV